MWAQANRQQSPGASYAPPSGPAPGYAGFAPRAQGWSATGLAPQQVPVARAPTVAATPQPYVAGPTPVRAVAGAAAQSSSPFYNQARAQSTTAPPPVSQSTLAEIQQKLLALTAHSGGAPAPTQPRAEPQRAAAPLASYPPASYQPSQASQPVAARPVSPQPHQAYTQPQPPTQQPPQQHLQQTLQQTLQQAPHYAQAPPQAVVATPSAPTYPTGYTPGAEAVAEGALTSSEVDSLRVVELDARVSVRADTGATESDARPPVLCDDATVKVFPRHVVFSRSTGAPVVELVIAELFELTEDDPNKRLVFHLQRAQGTACIEVDCPSDPARSALYKLVCAKRNLLEEALRGER